MTHPAAHHSITVISRGKGRSAAAAAAYCAGTRIRDERTGLDHDYRRKAGVRSVEVVGHSGDPGALWNAAEAAEKRKNACVARETILALPHALPPERQAALVRGYALWLRDRYGVAVMTAIHEPSRRGDQRNVHAHLLETTREVDRASGAFGAKVRVMDDRKTGRLEVEARRQEWARRVNRELARAGIAGRVDPRSYRRRAEAGDAPPGLMPIAHQGPARTALLRREQDRAKFFGSSVDRAPLAFEAEARRRRQHNAELTRHWLFLRAELRARERERAAQALRDAETAARERFAPHGPAEAPSGPVSGSRIAVPEDPHAAAIAAVSTPGNWPEDVTPERNRPVPGSRPDARGLRRRRRRGERER